MKKGNVVLITSSLICIILFAAYCAAGPILWLSRGAEVETFSAPIIVILPGLATSCFLFSFKKSYLKHISIPAGACILTAIYFALSALCANKTLLKQSALLYGFEEFSKAGVAVLYFFCTFFLYPVLIMYLTWIITKGKFKIGKCALLTLTSFVIMTLSYYFYYSVMPGSMLILTLIPVMLVPSLSSHKLHLNHKLRYCGCVSAGCVASMLTVRVGVALITEVWELVDFSLATIDLGLFHFEIAAFLFGVAVCGSILYLAHIIRKKKQSKITDKVVTVSQPAQDNQI